LALCMIITVIYSRFISIIIIDVNINKADRNENSVNDLIIKIY